MNSNWNQYKLRKTTFWISVVIFFGWMWFWSSYPEMLMVSFIVGVAIIGAAALFYAKWKCPRCHNSFVLRGAYGNVLTTKCLHCGLNANAPEEEINNKAYALKT